MDEYLTTDEVADLLRVPPATIRWWRHCGDRGPRGFRLPGTRRVLYARDEVEQFIAEARAEVPC